MKKNNKVKKYKREKRLYRLFVVTTIFLVVGIIYSRATLSKINLEIQELNDIIKDESEDNQSLAMKINEMVSLDKIREVSNEQGLIYNNENIYKAEYILEILNNNPVTHDKKNLNNHILNVFNTYGIHKLIAQKSPFHTGNNIHFNLYPVNGSNIANIKEIIPINKLESTVKNLNIPSLLDSSIISPGINLNPVNIIIEAHITIIKIIIFKIKDILYLFIVPPYII